MLVAAFLIAQASLNTERSAVCSNNSVSEIEHGERVVVDQVGAEHAGFTISTRRGSMFVNDSDIFARWRRATRVSLPSGRIVLRRMVRAVTYAFPDLNDEEKPRVVISGTALNGSKADFPLLERIYVYPNGLAEKDPRCTQVLHYGWENILGPRT